VETLVTIQGLAIAVSKSNFIFILLHLHIWPQKGVSDRTSCYHRRPLYQYPPPCLPCLVQMKIQIVT